MKIKIENLIFPLGLDVCKPRFSYIIENGKKNSVQKTNRIIVKEGENIVWDSQIVATEKSHYIKYDGAPLKPYTRYDVDIWVTDNENEEFTGNSFFETGKLNEEFKGSYITADFDTKADLTSKEHEYNRPVVFEKKFTLQSGVKKARLYITSMGINFCEINGKYVGDMYLSPGWTAHLKHMQYYTYDISPYLQEGENTIDITVSNGWYNRIMQWADVNRQTEFSNNLAALAYISIENENSKITQIVTDDSWKYGFSNISFAGIFDGEHCCAFDEYPKDKPVRIENYNKSVLMGANSEGVKIIQKIPIKEIITTPKGELVLDVGQNVVGMPLVKVTGKKGDKVVLKFAEVFDNDGNFYNENYRSALCDYVYTLKDGYNEYMPKTTFYGFRYIKVCEFPGDVRLENFDICVICSDMERTGTFICDNEMLNKLNSNIEWGMKGNYVDIPTDCPQRDERLGWTADTHVFLETASYIYNVNNFLRKWLMDLALEQGEKGAIPVIIPKINLVDPSEKQIYVKDEFNTRNGLSKEDIEKGMDNVDYAAGWSDAVAICPYTMYEFYEDENLLSNQLESMTKWCDFLYNQYITPIGICTENGYGDWVALDAEDGDYVGATPIQYIADAFMMQCIKLTYKSAKILKNSSVYNKYIKMFEDAYTIFKSKYFTKDGVVNIWTQTAKILALKFELAPNMELQAELLAKQLEEDDCRLTVGFMGIPYILEALSDNGHLDTAYKTLLRRKYPSWLYQVDKGATTVWEHIDAIKEDGTFWSSNMNSMNHYAYGSVGSWLYSRIGGIMQDKSSPGFKHFIINPRPSTYIKSANTTFKTVYGTIRCKWGISSSKFNLDVVVPFNSTATIILPSGKTFEVGSGEYSFSE